MNKSIANKNLKSIMRVVEERSSHYDMYNDMVTTDSNCETQETYFNILNRLLPTDLYTSDNTQEIIHDRRITLRNIFVQRAIFLMDETLNFIKSSLESYGIICNTTAKDIMKYDHRMFDLDAYDRYIASPVCAGDCALLINSIIFNNVMNFRELSCEQNSLTQKELFEITNKILNIALLDLVHMFNLLYLEADAIYYPAGIMKGGPILATANINDECIDKEFLEGEEREKALKSIGREDLIDTDVKIRSF